MTDESELKEFPFLDADLLRRAAVVCHRNADADSYLSAFALSALIKALAPKCEVEIITPGGMTTLTSKLSSKFPHPTSQGGAGAEYDLYVAVDVGDEELLNEWKEKLARASGVKVLVDHHPLRNGGLYDRVLVDESATSAAEVVFSLFRVKGVEPDTLTSQALLEAILFDSSHLAIAGAAGLRAAVSLMESGADLPSARRDLRSEPDYGEVMAKLKGAQRTKLHRGGRWVVASSLVGSFQAHVARSLVYLGADLAVVAGETEGETRVSLRSTQRFWTRPESSLGPRLLERWPRGWEGTAGATRPRRPSRLRWVRKRRWPRP